MDTAGRISEYREAIENHLFARQVRRGVAVRGRVLGGFVGGVGEPALSKGLLQEEGFVCRRGSGFSAGGGRVCMVVEGGFIVRKGGVQVGRVGLLRSDGLVGSVGWVELLVLGRWVWAGALVGLVGLVGLLRFSVLVGSGGGGLGSGGGGLVRSGWSGRVRAAGFGLVWLDRLGWSGWLGWLGWCSWLGWSGRLGGSSCWVSAGLVGLLGSVGAVGLVGFGWVRCVAGFVRWSRVGWVCLVGSGPMESWSAKVAGLGWSGQ